LDNIAPFLSDAEVYELCFPLRMPAAQVRFLRNRLRLHVSVKPNGRPIVMRSELERVIGASRLGLERRRAEATRTGAQNT
jgi:uncharacterized protein (DUF1499 family)